MLYRLVSLLHKCRRPRAPTRRAFVLRRLERLLNCHPHEEMSTWHDGGFACDELLCGNGARLVFELRQLQELTGDVGLHGWATDCMSCCCCCCCCCSRMDMLNVARCDGAVCGIHPWCRCQLRAGQPLDVDVPFCAWWHIVRMAANDDYWNRGASRLHARRCLNWNESPSDNRAV